MKATKFNNLTKYISPGVFIVMIQFLIYSCATNVHFLQSAVVPAATGTVKVKLDSNKNYAIDISVSDLAEVNRLQPPKNSYVVWMVTEQEGTKNIGLLVSSKGFISKRHKGSFNTVSSVKPIKIFITAEDDTNIQYPGTQVVLSTDSFRPK